MSLIYINPYTFAAPAGIVTSGLVLNLDAGDTASYPGSGTTWTDLSGSGINGTLVNGPTFDSANGGSLVFDGSNDRVDCTGSITLTAATFICWAYRNGNQVTPTQPPGLIYSRDGFPANGLNIETQANNYRLGYNWGNDSAAYNFNTSLNTPSLAWFMAALTVAGGNSSAATFYLCQSSGITTATNTINHPSQTLSNIIIARDDPDTRCFKGSIAQALIYNRALTAAEVTQNFNALKSRYGL